MKVKNKCYVRDFDEFLFVEKFPRKKKQLIKKKQYEFKKSGFTMKS